MPITEVDLDGSSGVLFPFYDADTSMLYLVGKVSLAREGAAAWGPWSAGQGQSQAGVAASSPPVVSPQPCPTFRAPQEHLGPP